MDLDRLGSSCQTLVGHTRKCAWVSHFTDRRSLGLLLQGLPHSVRPWPARFRVCIRRPRIYSVLLRKGCVRVVHDLHLAYKHVCEALRVRGAVPLSDLFFATPSKLLEEENRKRQQGHLCPLAGHTSDLNFAMITWVCGNESAGRIQHRTILVCSTLARTPLSGDHGRFALDDLTLCRPCDSVATCCGLRSSRDGCCLLSVPAQWGGLCEIAMFLRPGYLLAI